MVCYDMLCCDPWASSIQEFYVSIGQDWTRTTAQVDVWFSSCIFTKTSDEAHSKSEYVTVFFQVGKFFEVMGLAGL